jgi:hypothetical protein
MKKRECKVISSFNKDEDCRIVKNNLLLVVLFVLIILSLLAEVSAEGTTRISGKISPETSIELYISYGSGAGRISQKMVKNSDTYGNWEIRMDGSLGDLDLGTFYNGESRNYTVNAGKSLFINFMIPYESANNISNSAVNSSASILQSQNVSLNESWSNSSSQINNSAENKSGLTNFITVPKSFNGFNTFNTFVENIKKYIFNVYVMAGLVVIVLLIIVFIFIRKVRSSGRFFGNFGRNRDRPIVVKKLSTIRSSRDDDELRAAEEKLKRAQQEFSYAQEKRKRIEEAEKKIKEDYDRLNRLKRGY